MAKKEDFSALTLEELNKKESDLRHDLFNYKMQAKTGQLEDTKSVEKTRRNIARVLTFKKQKQSKSA
jgi:large subunit ribosomal protein L29